MKIPLSAFRFSVALLAVTGAAIVSISTTTADTVFPLRTQYRDVRTIETSILAKRFNQAVIVDVRSKYEHDTLHIKDSVLIPISESRFVEEVRKLRAKTNKAIVFYCNGVTCRKSYDAAVMANIYYIANTYTYDAGMDAWAKAHPELSVLLGKSPVKVESLISDAQFNARVLKPKDFEARIGPSTLVLDVRDAVQRRVIPFSSRIKESWAQLDEPTKLDAVIEQAIRDKKTLLVYDQVGRQVRWFQYYLENKGMKDYYFLKGGAEAYANTMPPARN